MKKWCEHNHCPPHSCLDVSYGRFFLFLPHCCHNGYDNYRITWFCFILLLHVLGNSSTEPPTVFFTSPHSLLLLTAFRLLCRVTGSTVQRALRLALPQ